jgi:hypothetical protein
MRRDKLLIDGFCGEGLPTIEFAHGGLAGSKQRPEQHGGRVRQRRHSLRRLPNLPDLPTISETVPGVVSSGWIVLMAPAGTPTVAAPQQRTPINQTVSGYSVTG